MNIVAILQFVAGVIVGMLAVMGLKTLIFGQYWPQQFRPECPHCKRRAESRARFDSSSWG